VKEEEQQCRGQYSDCDERYAEERVLVLGRWHRGGWWQFKGSVFSRTAGRRPGVIFRGGFVGNVRERLVVDHGWWRPNVRYNSGVLWGGVGYFLDGVVESEVRMGGGIVRGAGAVRGREGGVEERNSEVFTPAVSRMGASEQASDARFWAAEQ